MPPAEERPTDIDIEVLPPYGKTGSDCRRRVIATEELCVRHRIDAVIFNAYGWWQKFIDYLAFRRARKDRAICCYLQFHSSFTVFQVEAGSTKLQRIAHTLGIYDGLIAESDTDTAFWSLFAERVLFRPLPIPCDLSSVEPSSLTSHDVLYLARVSSTKNQIDAIQAFQHVLRKVPDARLIITGDAHDAYSEKCHALANDLGIAASIVFLDYVRAEEKTQLLSSVCCALSTSKYEGYAIALAECKAYGLPLVMYDIPNLTISEGGVDNGTISVRQNDVEALSRAMVYILQDESFRKALGQKSRNRMLDIYHFDEREFWNELFTNGPVSYNSQNQKMLTKYMVKSFFNMFTHTSTSLDHEREEDAQALASSLNGMRDSLLSAASRIGDFVDICRVSSGRIKVTTPAQSFKDVTVEFPRELTDDTVVFSSPYTTSQDIGFSALNCSAIKINTNGCTIRVFNGSTLKRTSYVYWLALSPRKASARISKHRSGWRYEGSVTSRLESGSVRFEAMPHSIVSIPITLKQISRSIPDAFCAFGALDNPAQCGLLRCATSEISPNCFELHIFNNSDLSTSGTCNWIATPSCRRGASDFQTKLVPFSSYEQSALDLLAAQRELEDALPSSNHVQFGKTEPLEVRAHSSEEIIIPIKNHQRVVPRVLASLYSTSKSADIGYLTCSVTDVSAKTIRITLYNSGDSTRKPSISWLAIYDGN